MFLWVLSWFSKVWIFWLDVGKAIYLLYVWLTRFLSSACVYLQEVYAGATSLEYNSLLEFKVYLTHFKSLVNCKCKI